MKRKRRVLIVEDEERARQVLDTVLKKAGYEVDQAVDGEAAIACIEARRPDLILLDMVMPGMSGWAFLRRFRGKPSPPPIIIVSGEYYVPGHLGELEKYVCGYVAKPYNFVSFVRTCGRVLASAEAAPKASAHEKRADPRHNLLLRVTLLDGNGLPFAEGQMTDLSLGGAQLDIDMPLALGETVHFTCEIPDQTESLRLSGQVRWSAGGRVGVAFAILPVKVKRRLMSLLAPVKQE